MKLGAGDAGQGAAALEAGLGVGAAWRPRPGRARRWALGAGALGLLVGAALAVVEALGEVNAGGWPLAARFFAAVVEPRLDAAFLEVVTSAALTTLAYAVLGTVLALVLGLTAGPLLAQAGWEAGGRRPPRAIRGAWVVARGALALPRGVHEVVWALVLLAILGLDPLVAVLAIGLPYGAVTAKVTADLLDEAPRAPMTALLIAGASRPVALLHGLVPAALGDLVAYAFYRFECSLRAAAILGIVGAGGLGFQLALSFQALRYGEMWTIIAALVVLAAAVEGWSGAVRRRLGAERRAGCAPQDGSAPLAGPHPPQIAPAARPGPPARPGRDPVVVGSLVLVGVLAVGSAWWLAVDLSTLWASRTLSLFGQVLADAWPPDFAGAGGTALLGQALTTLAMAALGAGLAFVLALGLVVPGAAALHLRPSARGGRVRRPLGRLPRGLLRAPLLMLRAVPPPVWAFVLLLVLFPGILPGAVALALYNLGVLGRLFAEAVEEVDERPLRALEGVGATRAQVIVCGLVPAALTRFAAHGLERWEMAIRDTVVVGLVGAGGLGLALDGQLASFAFGAVAATLLVLLALTFAVDLAGSALRRALR
ncbi:MAG TPA: ABC transporter permease subunit [Solirubrobacteraceae bacterium]|nr:ABC transporter permease subunit [Solirubrobacteraceae bacterium]